MGPSRSGELARAAALCLALLGLTCLIAFVSRARPTPSQLAAQFATFAVVSTLLARGVASPPGPGHHGADRLRLAGWSVAALVAFGVVIAWLPWYWSVTGLTLLGASVEEFVFRRELPGALTRLLQRGAGRWAGAAGVSLAQAVFAACHLAVVAPGPHLGSLALLRFAAAGACLVGLYQGSGTLAIPVAVHFGINWSVVHA